MRKSTFGFLLAAALLFAASPSFAQCNYLRDETRVDYWGVTTVGSDCWFDATPNAMVTYFKYDKEYHVNKYKVYQCTWGLNYVFDSLIYVYHNQCWSPTATRCVGNKDWEPSPQC